jgi:hypothetical protein
MGGAAQAATSMVSNSEPASAPGRECADLDRDIAPIVAQVGAKASALARIECLQDP